MHRIPAVRADLSERGRFLRMVDVVDQVSLSAPTINRLHRRGEFPAKVRISERAIGWWESDIEAWKASRGRAVQTTTK